MSDFQRGVLLGMGMVLAPIAWGVVMAWINAHAEREAEREIERSGQAGRRIVERMRESGVL